MEKVFGLILALLLLNCQPEHSFELRPGCSDQQTTGVITDQAGEVADIGFSNQLFIRLPAANPNKVYYRPCNMPSGLKAGQHILFSANIKYQYEGDSTFVIDYAGQAIELTKVVTQ